MHNITVTRRSISFRDLSHLKQYIRIIHKNKIEYFSLNPNFNFVNRPKKSKLNNPTQHNKMTAESPKIKLTYFDIEGVAESVRLAFTFAGVDFEWVTCLLYCVLRMCSVVIVESSRFLDSWFDSSRSYLKSVPSSISLVFTSLLVPICWLSSQVESIRRQSYQNYTINICHTNTHTHSFTYPSIIF